MFLGGSVLHFGWYKGISYELHSNMQHHSFLLKSSTSQVSNHFLLNTQMQQIIDVMADQHSLLQITQICLHLNIIYNKQSAPNQ